MDSELARKILSQMNRETFWRFVGKMLEDSYIENDESPYDVFETIEDFPVPAYRAANDHHFSPSDFVYLFDFIPFQIFESLSRIKIDTSFFTECLRKLKPRYPYINGYGCYGYLEYLLIINNFYGDLKVDYEEHIFTQYAVARDATFPGPRLGYGNTETFLLKQPETVITTLKDFVFRRPDGIVIQIGQDDVKVDEYFQQETYDRLTKRTLTSLEVGLLLTREGGNETLREFEIVLKNENEAKLEQFLCDNYQLLFGENYNQIRTQVFLKFPHLDIYGKNRRLDIMLRNNSTNDWELFEIKPNLEITKTYRGVDTFKSVVHDSITQVRNYGDLLAKDNIKRELKKEGMEYCTPVLNLVIGGAPTIDHSSYRRLVEQNSKDVKIITFDRLIEDAKSRLSFVQKTLNWIGH